MKRVEAFREFDVSVERGFAFITDTRNWPKFWPGYVRLEEGSRWGAPGDTARLVTRLLGRERLLTMTITAFEPNRLVRYTSIQHGLPNALHERHFEPADRGFRYRLVVEFEPRPRIRGLVDRFFLPGGVRRAFQRTFAALARELASSSGERAAPRGGGPS
jgi:uncharacterized protein YndB with AHSA1/START domain